MEKKIKKVLLVEDNEDWNRIIKRGLGDKVQILSAYTIKEAEKIFEENSGIAIVIMDACVPGDTPNTQPLVQKIRQTFKGPMIAMSSMPMFRRKIVLAGCDHEVEEKTEAGKKVLELLGIS